MKVEDSLSSHPGLLYWLGTEFGFLLGQSQQDQFGIFGHPSLSIHYQFYIIRLNIYFEAPIMQFWKKAEKGPFTDIKRIAEGLPHNSSQAALEKIVSILNKLFPSLNQSLLSTIYEDATKSYMTDNTLWKKSLVEAVELFSPQSEIGKAIFANKDARIPIESLNSSGDLQNYLKRSQLKQIQGARREDYIFQVPLLEYFFINLAICIPYQKDQEKKEESWEEAFFEDYFYYYIVRNPILLVIKNWLAYSKSNFPLFTRILKVIEIVILRDIATNMRKKERVPIRNPVVHTVYLISEMSVGKHHWEFLESLSQNMDKRTNSSSILTAWIRLNLSIIMNSTAIEQQSRLQLRNFQPRTSPFSRHYFQNKEDINHYNFAEIDKKIFTNFLYKIQSLLSKRFWESTPAFVQSIYLIICIVEKIMPNDTSFRLQFLRKIFSRGLYKENKLFSDIKNYYLSIVPRPYEMEEEDEFNNEDNYDSSSLRYRKEEEEDKKIRRSLMTHQGDLTCLNIWMKPLQPNESQILLQISKSTAFLVDKIRRKAPQKETRGGSKEMLFPCTDLRWMASWKLFCIILGVLFLMKMML